MGDIYYNRTETPIIIHPSVKSSKFDRTKWLNSILIHIPNNVDFLASQLESIYDENGNFRGCLLPPEHVPDDDETPFSLTIGGLSSELYVPTILSDDHGVIGYIEGIGKRISRDKVILDIPLKKQLSKWVKKKYEFNYNLIVNDKKVAFGYRKLIELCELKDVIANDNIERLYSMKPTDITVGTIKGMMKIHLYLFAGVQEYAGIMSEKSNIEYLDKTAIDFIFDQAIEIQVFLEKLRQPYNRYFRNRDKKIIVCAIVGLLPASTFKEIINKYCLLLLCHPFVDGNKRTMGVWVNLLLDFICKKKVVWKKVNEKELMQKIDSTYGKTLRHLVRKIEMREVTETFVKELTNKIGDDVSNYLKDYLT